MAKASETRARIIKAAIRCFAREGVFGVSLRAVSKEAGQKNTAAVHYHFGDREGLLKASLDFILAAISEPVSWEEAGSLGCERPKELSPLHSLLYEEYLPILLLPLRVDWGEAGIQLLSRVVLGEFATLALHLEQETWRESERMVLKLHQHLPGISQEELGIRLEYAMVTLICGAAAARYDEIVAREWGETLPPVAHIPHLLNFIAAGISS